MLKARLQHAPGICTAPKMTYSSRDGPDYLLMMTIIAGLGRLCYARSALLQAFTYCGCLYLTSFFFLHHGCSLSCPLLLSDPKTALRAAQLHIKDIKLVVFLRVAIALSEHCFVTSTPSFWHATETVSELGRTLWWLHFGLCSTFRTVIFWEHLRWHINVRAFLQESNFARHIIGPKLFPLQIAQAYCTGIVCHLCLLMPWYAVITWRKQSILLMPVNFVLDLLHEKYSSHNAMESYYREHWLGHHSRLHFIYLHGMHHDALPCALIATNDSGALEGFLRSLDGTAVGPCRTTWYVSHILQLVNQTRDVLNDIILHQYIPCVYPYSRLIVARENHHVEHHYLALHPIGSAGGGGTEKFLVEAVDGYNAENKLWNWFVQAVQNAPESPLCRAERVFWWLKKIP